MSAGLVAHAMGQLAAGRGTIRLGNVKVALQSPKMYQLLAMPSPIEPSSHCCLGCLPDKGIEKLTARSANESVVLSQVEHRHQKSEEGRVRMSIWAACSGKRT